MFVFLSVSVRYSISVVSAPIKMKLAGEIEYRVSEKFFMIIYTIKKKTSEKNDLNRAFYQKEIM